MAGPIAFLVPDPIQSTQLIPGGNTPASGGLLFVYQVGSTTKSNSYTDPSASTARTNPIVLDSGGNIPGNGEVWITSTAKFVLAPFNDTDPPSSPYWSKDNYPGINLITAAQVQALSAQSEWVQGSTATFVGVTGFSVVGDQTALYTLGRRVKATVTGGDRFGIVTSAVLSTGSTAVGVTLDSGTLNGGLSVISYGILSTPNGSIPWTQITSTGINAGLAAVTTNSLSIIRSLDLSASTAGQIVFPSIQNSSASGRVFDDYNESTWVPTIGSTAIYGSQVGNYTKIGRIVYVEGIVQPSNISTGSSPNIISGLPFPGTSINGTPIALQIGGSSTAIYSAIGQVVSTTIAIWVRTNSTASDIQTGIFANNTAVRFSGCYQTNT